jgi:hypothetical protein
MAFTVPFVTQAFELGVFGVWAKAIGGWKRKEIQHPAKISNRSLAPAARLEVSSILCKQQIFSRIISPLLSFKKVHLLMFANPGANPK